MGGNLVPSIYKGFTNGACVFGDFTYSQDFTVQTFQWPFTCSKLTIETLEQGVKYVQTEPRTLIQSNALITNRSRFKTNSTPV